MAKTRLSTATGVTRGYGQVEPNHLSAQRTGQIYAQLPLGESLTQVENGQFVKYDYANGEVNKTGAGEWMLVYNEVKLYDAKETAEDFVLTNANSSEFTAMDDDGTLTMPAYEGTYPKPFTTGSISVPVGKPVPRVFKTNIGDIFTTNAINSPLTEEDLQAVVYFTPGSNGFLDAKATPLADETGMAWVMTKKGIWTLPDGQVALQLQRVQ